MSKMKFLISLVMAVSILIVQVGGAFAAPALQAFPPIKGTVQSITLETDPNTGITTVVVTVVDSSQALQVVRVSQQTAMKRLKLIGLDGDGKPVINKLALGEPIEIELTMVVPNKTGDEHPVADALANFFSESLGENYDTMYDMIMTAHNGDFGADEGFDAGKGFGFGTIAQALWLTKEINGDSNLDTFKVLLLAKQRNDYTGIFDDGTTPENWGQLRTAILEGKEVRNLGAVMSDKNGNQNGNPQVQNKDKEKRDKDNKGNANEDSEKEKEKRK